MELIQRIKTKQVKIGIMGLGYVGLPLVIEFCKRGFQVNGFDVDNEKVELLKQGKSYIKHINSSLIIQHSSLFTPTSDFSRLSEMDCVIICVPTPLNKYREPDMSYVFNSNSELWSTGCCLSLYTLKIAFLKNVIFLLSSLFT